VFGVGFVVPIPAYEQLQYQDNSKGKHKAVQGKKQPQRSIRQAQDLQETGLQGRCPRLG
jgi:hypothetical protein